ncbi:hypothetical protein [Undibacterium sp.]|uniref:hypothetical protein n=1 Tax=Undibacterium sp. TaxID=1914977 RepID=UPI0037529DEB
MFPKLSPQNQMFLPRSGGQRLFSALFSIAISLFFLTQLNRDFIAKVLPATTLPTNVMLLSFLQKPVSPIKPLIPPTPKTPAPARPTAIKVLEQKKIINDKDQTTIEAPAIKTSPETKTESELIRVFPEVSSTTPASPSSSAQVGISRFKYDSASVRQAYEASKTDIQKMAEKSGTTLEDPKLTKHDKFQQAANRAAKPDCLRQGGSILSLFVVAYQVATDHCK